MGDDADRRPPARAKGGAFRLSLLLNYPVVARRPTENANTDVSTRILLRLARSTRRK